MPGIVIVQHMPGSFTKSFAQRLDHHCRLTVKEAESGERIRPGTAYLAPGDQHLLLKNQDKGYCVELNDGPLVCRHRPSVDALFRSTAQVARHHATGVILTGMGDDGAQGMLEMKEAGSFNIAQDEASSCLLYTSPSPRDRG